MLYTVQVVLFASETALFLLVMYWTEKILGGVGLCLGSS